MIEFALAFAGTAFATEERARELLNSRPGGIVRVTHPNDVQFLPRPKAAPDCKGCGAPLKAYIHHCEYCRRAAC